MSKFTSITLAIVAVALLIYPLWPLVQPDSYRSELAAHYAYDQGASINQVKKAAKWLYLPNGILAFALFWLSYFFLRPQQRLAAWVSAIGLGIYPVVKAYSVAVMGMILTQHVESPSPEVSISAEGLFYVLVAFVVASIPSLVRGV